MSLEFINLADMVGEHFLESDFCYLSLLGKILEPMICLYGGPNVLILLICFLENYSRFRYCDLSENYYVFGFKIL